MIDQLAQLAPPLTEQADDIDRVWNAFLIAASVVGAIVAVLILYVMVRFRRRDVALPHQRRENIPVEITYVVVPFLLVIALFAVTFVSVEAVEDAVDEPDLTVEVVAFQWQWQFDYPDAGVSVIGTDTEIPELVLPASATVRFELTSIDVIHSFWITGFRYKRDIFPGQVQEFDVVIGDATGEFPLSGVCAEFCGLDHTTMRFSVRVVSPEEFDRWVQERTQEAA